MGVREQNIAASLQKVTEEIIFHLLNRLHALHPVDNVVIVGGCAMNSVANGKITTQTPFKQAFIPVGAADNGTAFGAAFDVWNRVLGKPRGFELTHGFWGPSFATEECAAAAQAYPVKATVLAEDDLLNRAVDALCDGKVVGWFQGRMEFGARALGCRSLLADPRRADMRDIINLKIKFREKFRPFAPSILADHVGEWFELDEPSPFMEKVFPIRAEKRAQIPAVTHVDGSGRLQSVTKESNPRYHELIRRFHARTGVPIVLNTSLNENEPIVHTPEQAIDCFLRTKMDHIVLDRVWVDRT
jgi:carbamoyltransferase